MLSRFPVPGSRFPVPGSRFPVPGSRFPVPGSAAGQGWGVGVNALRLRGRSETEWDIIESRTDRLEQTVPSAAAVLGGGFLDS